MTYVTRAYLTRHGAGPLPRERPEKPYPGIVDTTNVPNEHQGTLRFAWLDLDLLRRAIHEDLSDAAAYLALIVHAVWPSPAWINSTAKRRVTIGEASSIDLRWKPSWRRRRKRWVWIGRCSASVRAES